VTKEYVLKIIYDMTTDEIQHLSERCSHGFSIEVNGKDIPISDEMGDYMLKHVENEELGIS